MKHSNVKLEALQNGESFERLPVLVDRDTVKDATGSRIFSGPARRGAALISGVVNDHGALQISESEPLTVDEQLIPRLFPNSRFSREEMAREFDEFISAHFEHEALDFAAHLKQREEFASFGLSPAAMSNHHAFVGGLLEHTLSMLRIAQSLAEHYETLYPEMIDRGVLLCGVLMHDFCKTEELTFTDHITYSKKGRLLGHISMGFALVSEVCSQTSVSDEFTMRLQHAVLSHHGKREYGAPIEPQTPEAMLLHQVDMIDSRMNMCWNAYSTAKQAGETWSEYRRNLGARIYVGETE